MKTHHVIISNLPYEVSSAELLAFVSPIVPGATAEVEVDSVTSRSLGKAVLSFESVTDATRAVDELKTKQLHGRTLEMQYATAETLAKVRAGG